MYTMAFKVRVGNYWLGMIDKIEVKTSVEVLSNTAIITLPGAEYNEMLDVESKIKRGDVVLITFGYTEEHGDNLPEEFFGYVQRIGTDDGNITIECEDELFMFRKPMENQVLQKVSLEALLKKVVDAVGGSIEVKCTYSWNYEKFVINNATALDVLKKVQEECGADIYYDNGVLHVHSPYEKIGKERKYDFAYNIEESDLTYRTAKDKKVEVTVKATLPDGKIKEIKVGATGGDKIEVICPTHDEQSMKQRGETEVLKHSFDGYEGSITTWLIPFCKAGDTATLHDDDYPSKDGTYFVTAVTTTFDKSGGKRNIDLGMKLS